MKKVSLLKVFVASPGDTQQQRAEIEEIILQWNRDNTEHRDIILMPVKWEDNATPSYNDDTLGQDVINNQLLLNSDILIALFYMKLGTPVGEHLSGTVSEIELFYEKNKDHAGVFFIEPEDEEIRKDNFESYMKLLNYKDSLSQKGLYSEYSKEKLYRYLNKEVIKIVNKEVNKEIIKITKDRLTTNEKIEDEVKQDKEEMNSKLINKSYVLEYIKQKTNKLSNVSFDKASIKEGGGFLINQQPVMLKRSKDYNNNRENKIKGIEYSGWSTVMSGYEEYSYQFIFFCILHFDGNKNQYSSFIIPKIDFEKILEKKDRDVNGRYHFYIQKVEGEEKYVDSRTKGSENNIDLTPYHEAWHFFEK